MSHNMRATSHPRERAINLIEYVSRTRNSNIFDEENCFEMKQKWLLVLPVFLILLLLMLFFRKDCNCWKKEEKKKIKIV